MSSRKIWSAHWIADERFVGLEPRQLLHKESDSPDNEAHRNDLKHTHMLVRKTFDLEASVRAAYIDISADDYYKLFVNGRFVGQGPAQGYHFHYYYNRYDLTEWLVEGLNVIAVHAYYQGLCNRSLNSADYRQGVIAELFCDGTLTVATDATWKYMQSLEYGTGEAATIGYDTQFAEHIDSRLKEANWRHLHYDDSAWKPACVRRESDCILQLQSTPSVDVYRVSPTKVETTADGRYLIDFGREITGQLTMIARGLSGQQLEIRCGEEWLEDSSGVRCELRCNCTYREAWTLSGGEDELEVYDYKGFRLAEVIGGVDAVQPESIAAIVRHYPFPEEACRFQSDDPLLQGIWDICRNAVKYGSQEHFVDCPTREKGQYLGDNSITAPAHALLTGDLRLYRKALEDFALSSRICPGFMAVAPGHLMQEYADYSLQWPAQLLQYYRYSGDRPFLREMAPLAVGIINYFRRYARADGLLRKGSDKANLVDWPPNARDGYDFPLTKPVIDGCHNVVNAFYYGAMQATNGIMRELGEPELYELASLAESFRRAFLDPSTGLFRDAEMSGHASLHANALPLCFGLVPRDQRDAVVAFLKEKKLSCGVYMAYFYLKALATAGEHEFVYHTIVSQEKHLVTAADVPGTNETIELTGYWANMLREGATTCFEAWSKRLKWNTSLCHPWASAPIPLLVEDVLGITPAEPGWTSIRFRPRIPRSMRDLTLVLTVATGVLTVRVRDGKAELQPPAGVSVV
ncbi:family 78 glycoside hydrolase catalytic domain [Paenibacillus hodogayensis]|uniref:alpha-L-rhamnosidase n=1 Tax=Paenibacillus hodogayensis TaxID=279208 RepID=A0ABV5W3R0_9BACL